MQMSPLCRWTLAALAAGAALFPACGGSGSTHTGSTAAGAASAAGTAGAGITGAAATTVGLPPGAPSSPAAAVVIATAQKTQAAGSANVSVAFSVQGGPPATSPMSITGGTLTGPFNFTRGSGKLALTLQGGLASTLGSSLQGIYDNGNLYLKVPPAGSALAIIAAGKGYVEVSLPGIGNFLGIPTGGLASILTSNPVELLDLFDTSALSATTVGQETVDGVSATHYKTTTVVAQAAASPGPAQSLYAKIQAASGSGPQLSGDVWIDPSGRLVQLATSVPLPTSPNGSSNGTLVVNVGFSGFGVTANFPPPPASDVTPFSATGLGG